MALAVLENNHLLLNGLLSRIKSGDRQAEADLFHQGNILDTIRRICYTRFSPGSVDLEDITADIAIQLITCLREGRYQPDRARLGSYLYGISRNKMREYYRHKSHLHSPLEHDPFADETILPNMEQTELIERIMDVLKALDLRHREVIILRYIREMSIEDIAEILCIRPTQVYNRIHYALQLVRSRI